VAQWNDKVNTFGTARARLGYIAGPWLFYATGGFAWEFDKLTRTQLTAPETLVLGPPAILIVDTKALQSDAAVTASHLRAGWTAGAGDARSNQPKLRTHVSFIYQAGSWDRARKVVARLECSSTVIFLRQTDGRAKGSSVSSFMAAVAEL
jgi:hypothetical protein